MSRGHGDLQCFLLENLSDPRGTNTWKLTESYYGEWTPANCSAVRRALRRLEAEGLVEHFPDRYLAHGRPNLWREV